MERYNVRRSVPKIPYSLDEFVSLLTDERYAPMFKSANGSSIFRDYNKDIENIGDSVIFISPTIGNLLTTSKEFYVDTTFKLKVQNPKTEVLLVIMAIFKEDAYPVAYVLMTNKSQTAYISVFQRMQQIVPSFMPNTIFIELEIDLYKALSFVFKEAKLYKCWGHMNHDLDKLAKSQNMHNEERYCEDVILQKLFNMSKAMVLLPPSKIDEGFEILKLLGTQSNNRDVVACYLAGFQVWCKNHIGGDSTSYTTARCTDIDTLFFHNTLLMNLQYDEDKTIWDFIKALLINDHKYYINYKRMLEPFNFQQQNRNYLQIQNKITSGYLCVMQNRLTVEEFLIYFGALAYKLAENIGTWYLRFIPVEVPQRVTDIVEGNAWNQGQFENRIRAQEQRAAEFEVLNPMDYIVPEDEGEESLIGYEVLEIRRAVERNALPKVIINPADLELREENCCCICLCNAKSHACIPCGHFCLCEDCAEGLISKCPICNAELLLIKRIHF